MNKGLKETDYLAAWALFAICATAGGFLVGAVVGGILGFALGSAGGSVQAIQVVSGIAGFLVGLPVSYACFRFFVGRMIVRKLLDQQQAIPGPGFQNPP